MKSAKKNSEFRLSSSFGARKSKRIRELAVFTVLRAWLPYLVVFGCLLPFLGKPVHIDDANFLRLAEGAQEDFWRPHDVLINWQGETERAFDVLSNPPGIAWWLGS